MKEAEIREAWNKEFRVLYDGPDCTRITENSMADWWLALRAKELGEVREKQNQFIDRACQMTPHGKLTAQEAKFVLSTVDDLIEKPI
jgi:hypothetical protein